MAVLIPALVISLIAAALAALLVLADRVVNDYGECRIKINDERELTVSGGSTLLDCLTENRVFIPSACGGRSSCGLCKLKVLKGAGPVLPTEEPHLSADERSAHVRLSCCIKVRGDLEIEIPEEFFKISQYRARCRELRDLTHDIKLVRLELIEPETIEFVPGQYIQLEAPVYPENPEPVYRAYSIASDADDRKHLDLIIRLVPNGICTTWVFNYLQEGDEVKFNGPYGDFFIRDTDADMIFVAGGSGMAPFRSILMDMRRRQVSRHCIYFFGAVARRDMFMLEEIGQFENDLPNFTFMPALSRPAPGDDWDGESGLITEIVARRVPDGAGKEAYLCGSPGMIDACVAVLRQNGIDDTKIFFDKFA